MPDPALHEDLAETRRRLEVYAHWLDTAFRIPGTQLRIGLEPLIGLIPVAGDIAGLLLSSALVYEAQRLGAPRHVLMRMGANTLLDTMVGAVPVLGDVFDVAYKSNRRNLALLLRHLDRREDPRPGPAREWLLVAGLLGGLAAAIAAVVLLID